MTNTQIFNKIKVLLVQIQNEILDYIDFLLQKFKSNPIQNHYKDIFKVINGT